jgi:transcriptional regulator with XRE-family HTH domain
MDVGIILKRLRLMKAASQSDIAKLLNIERTTYAKWEGDKVMLKLDQAKKIAEIYGIPLSIFVDYIECGQILNPDVVTRGIRSAELKIKRNS